LAKARTRFTIMIVPHSGEAVTRFRAPLGLIQAGVVTLALFWVALLIFVNGYFSAMARMGELGDLRWVNSEQKAQIQYLTQETATLNQKLAYLAELDRQLRELADLEGTEPGPVWTAANQRLAALEGLPGEASPDQEAMGGVAPPTAGEPPRPEAGGEALSDAYQAVAQVQDMEAETAYRQQSLEGLRVALAERQAYLAALPSVWPTNGIITSSFGYRRSPFGWGSDLHEGLDIAAPYGTPVVATGDGRVTFAGWRANYGKTVSVDHGYGYTTLYGHNSKVLVGVGQRVKKGQVIAYVGSTGRSTGCHLHYEVRVQGKSVDPRRFLARAGR